MSRGSFFVTLVSVNGNMEASYGDISGRMIKLSTACCTSSDEVDEDFTVFVSTRGVMVFVANY